MNDWSENLVNHPTYFNKAFLTCNHLSVNNKTSNAVMGHNLISNQPDEIVWRYIFHGNIFNAISQERLIFLY